MPRDRSLRLCLATTPPPTTATSFTLNPPQSPVVSLLRFHQSPLSSRLLASIETTMISPKLWTANSSRKNRPTFGEICFGF
nr:hypothetical protein Iba_chr08fCG0040 [Ipomoea batatas]